MELLYKFNDFPKKWFNIFRKFIKKNKHIRPYCLISRMTLKRGWKFLQIVQRDYNLWKTQDKQYLTNIIKQRKLRNLPAKLGGLTKNEEISQNFYYTFLGLLLSFPKMHRYTQRNIKPVFYNNLSRIMGRRSSVSLLPTIMNIGGKWY